MTSLSVTTMQVWDLQTCRSALEQAFSSGVQLTPFTYLCHAGTALEKCGLLFSGIDKSLSLCNIALLNIVCHHLFFFECFRRSFIWEEFIVFEKFSIINSLTVLNSVVHGLFEITRVKTAGQRSERIHRKLLVELERQELREYYHHKLDNFLMQEAQRAGEGEGLELFGAGKLLLAPCKHLHHSWPKRFSQFKQLVHLFWYYLESNEKFEFLEAFHFGTKTFTDMPLELQNLPDVKEKGLFTSILPCVSPDGKWMAIRLESEGTTVQLYRAQHQRQHHPHWRNSVHVIKEVECFAFTNDSVFFLYFTVQRSLHTLCLSSGIILTSVSGVRPLLFTPEKQAGYIFQVDDEENIILVKDFPAFFSSFFPFVRADLMQVTFASADAVLVLYSDSTLALIKNDGRAFAWETPLTHSFGGSQKVKKAQFSSDGKLIATHQGTNILLYRTIPASAETSIDYGKCPDSVFEANDDFTVLHFTISADSTLFLFCIRRNFDLSFFAWNVQEKDLSASFDSPGLTSEDCCCCFSSNNMYVVICSEFYIEFWDHSCNPCRLLSRVQNDVPHTEIDKFTHCTVSPENDLLAYCITDKVLLCSLKAATDQCILQLPRAHLGKVEFCQFLKGSRYLISYGVDGTVFLWDLSEWKAVAFVKIAQGRESIITMAVSSEQDKLACATSFGRLKIIKLCGLKEKVLSKLPLSKGMGSEKMTEACGVQVGKPTAGIQNLTCSDSNEDLDVAELIEEMDFILPSDDSEDSDQEDELLD